MFGKRSGDNPLRQSLPAPSPDNPAAGQMVNNPDSPAASGFGTRATQSPVAQDPA